MTEVQIDLPVDPDEIRDRFSRLTALAIALITVIAATVGFLQASAVQQGDDAEVEAQRLGVEAFGVLVQAESDAQLELQAYARGAQDVALRWSYFHEALASGEGASSIDETAALWAQLAQLAARGTSITDTSPEGPEGDLTFPRRFLTERSEPGFRLSALQDSMVEYAGGWGSKAGTYTAILAMLAVSVYLLGLSLTVPAVIARRSFAFTGGALALAGTIWAVYSYATPPARIPEAAADAFARGRVTLLTATTQEEFRMAEVELTTAIELRPTFAQAYASRASARFSAGSPQRSGYLSLASPEAVRAAVDDLQQAMSLGLETRQVLGNLGFYTYLRGLESGSSQELDDSIALTRRAIDHPTSKDVPDDDTVLLANLGVALLAAGRTEEARAAYDRAIAGLEEEDAAGKKVHTVLTAIYIAAGAISDLELLLTHQPGLEPTVRELKSRLVQAVAQVDVEPSASAQVRLRETEIVFPGEFQFGVDVEGLTDTDYLSAYWYHQAADGSGWHVLPEVSGPLWYLDNDDEVDLRDGERHEDYNHLAPLIEWSWPPRCVDGGDYRGEIYLNGRLVHTVTGNAGWPHLQPWLFRDLGIALCGPDDWKRAPDRQPGYQDGYLSPDGLNGAFVYRTPNLEESLGVVLARQLEDTRLPDGLTKADEDKIYFLGQADRLRQSYTYDGGLLRARIALLPEEDVLLTLVVFGSDAFWDDGPCAKEDRDSGDECTPLNLLDSARVFDVAQSGTTPPPVEELSLGVVGFSRSMTEDGEQITPLEVAPAGTTQLCGSWTYEGMTNGITWSGRWYVNGEVATASSVIDGTWDGGADGTWWRCIGDAQAALEEGVYEFEIEVEDAVRSNALFLGGNHPIVDFALDNQSGTEVCYVWLSPPVAKNWGTQDLEAATIPTGTTSTLTMPAGTYDLLVEDCSEATVMEAFGVSVEAGAPPLVIVAPEPTPGPS